MTDFEHVFIPSGISLDLGMPGAFATKRVDSSGRDVTFLNGLHDEADIIEVAFSFEPSGGISVCSDAREELFISSEKVDDFLAQCKSFDTAAGDAAIAEVDWIAWLEGDEWC